MAKKQTFGDKVGKGSEDVQKKYIKLVRVSRNNQGSLKFNNSILGINADENPDNIVKEILNK